MPIDMSPNLNPSVLVKDLLRRCADELGWNDERRAHFVEELKNIAAMGSNQSAAFWRGVWFLTTQPFGYGVGERCPAEWRYRPGNQGGASILKMVPGGAPVAFKIRDILPCIVHGVMELCRIKVFGIDAEFAVGKGGLYGASDGDDMAIRFFRGWAPGSSVDGSGACTWEHRTPASNTAEEQVQNLLLLNEKLVEFLHGKTDPETGRALKLDRIGRTCGSHIHMHVHTPVSQTNLLYWLSRTAIIWNMNEDNAPATRVRWRACSDYGHANASRSPNQHNWGHGSCTVRGAAISMEYRAFTSPDFSDRRQVENFGNVIRCCEWTLQHATDLPIARGAIPSDGYQATAALKDEFKEVIQHPAALAVIGG